MELSVGRMTVIGLAHILATILLFVWYVSNSWWAIQHVGTTVATVMLLLNAFFIFMVGSGRVERAVERAGRAGYVPSNSEKKIFCEYLQETRKLVLIWMTIFSVLYMIHIYYLDSNIPGLFSDYTPVYVVVSYIVPYTVIINVLVYHTYKKYPDARILAKKAIQGAKLAAP